MKADRGKKRGKKEREREKGREGKKISNENYN